MVDGLAVVDKPAGMTSHDVVARCRRIFAQRRVGHAGTLDPDATGVLLVGVGQATRLMQFLSGLPKSYECRIVLGVATSTLDASGEVTGTWDMSGVTIEAARAAALAFTGAIEQIPPMVSAVKIGGRRLHELAREGIEVDRPARPVHVTRFDLRLGEPAASTGPLLVAEVDCSSGTYIRSLAADLGASLGGGAHLRDLRRTSVGPWTVADATPLDELGPEALRPPLAAVGGLDRVTVDDATATAVGHGRVLDRASIGVEGTGPWAVLSPSGRLVAVYADHGGGRAKPVVVLTG